MTSNFLSSKAITVVGPTALSTGAGVDAVAAKTPTSAVAVRDHSCHCVHVMQQAAAITSELTSLFTKSSSKFSLSSRACLLDKNFAVCILAWPLPLQRPTSLPPLLCNSVVFLIIAIIISIAIVISTLRTHRMDRKSRRCYNGPFALFQSFILAKPARFVYYCPSGCYYSTAASLQHRHRRKQQWRQRSQLGQVVVYWRWRYTLTITHWLMTECNVIVNRRLLPSFFLLVFFVADFTDSDFAPPISRWIWRQ